MDVLSLKSKIESVSDKKSIYLLEALNEISGFFTTDAKFLFIVKDLHSYPSEGIETDYLKLQTHIKINSVKNNQTFGDDFYNLIIYKGDLDDGNIDSFVQLCTVYARNNADINFKEFFYSLISLFQLPSEQSFKNIVGLYGELKLMQYAYERNSVDISNAWHRTGPQSKYDFSNGNTSLEIKTTTTGKNDIEIKHDQIFGESACILLSVICEQYENGETVEELVSQMYAEAEAFNGVNFYINLAKELKRVSPSDVKSIRFKIKDFHFYLADKINPFEYIPENISKLQYRIDLSDLECLSDSEIDDIFRSFI